MNESMYLYANHKIQRGRYSSNNNQLDKNDSDGNHQRHIARRKVTLTYETMQSYIF